jgi:hypothetical protein
VRLVVVLMRFMALSGVDGRDCAGGERASPRVCDRLRVFGRELRLRRMKP